MKYRSLEVSSLVSLFVLAGVSGAEAQNVTFSLSPTVIQIGRGQHVELTGTLFNGSTDTYSLTGGSGTVTGPDSTSLTLDDFDFVNNLPASDFTPNQTYTGSLFVDVAPDAAIGDYTLSYSVMGERNGVPVSFTSNARLTFVPSPEANLVMLFGMGGVIALRRRKAAHKN